MRTVAIIQARMGSSRLPGKVLMDLAGEPMLVHEVRRLQRARTIDDIVVATTTDAADDSIVRCAESEGVRSFRGSDRDVLSRYVSAAREAHADVIVRVTADCPLLDPDVVDGVVAALTPERDYASNVLERTFPIGLDVEALFHDTLERLGRIARSDAAREHVTWFIRNERPDLFVAGSLLDDEDNSDLRWTVDDRSDFEHVRALYAALDLAAVVRPYRDVVAFVRSSVAPAAVPRRAGT